MTSVGLKKMKMQKTPTGPQDETEIEETMPQQVVTDWSENPTGAGKGTRSHSVALFLPTGTRVGNQFMLPIHTHQEVDMMMIVQYPIVLVTLTIVYLVLASSVVFDIYIPTI